MLQTTAWLVGVTCGHCAAGAEMCVVPHAHRAKQDSWSCGHRVAGSHGLYSFRSCVPGGTLSASSVLHSERVRQSGVRNFCCVDTWMMSALPSRSSCRFSAAFFTCDKGGGRTGGLNPSMSLYVRRSFIAPCGASMNDGRSAAALVWGSLLCLGP